MIRTAIVSLFVSSLAMSGALYAYHTHWIKPSQQVGVVDVAEIYRAKEREYTEMLTKAGSTEADRTQALLMATQFATALPKALSEMPSECNCLVLLRTAVVADTPNTVDLTAAVREKLGIKG